MFFTFLNHQFTSFKRSRNRAGSLAANVVLWIFMLYFLLIAIGAGLFIKELIQKVFPQQDTIGIFNGLIMYYFALDFLLRVQLQELPALKVVPYLHLNISRSMVIRFLNISGLFSAFNLFPLFIFLPFIFTEIATVKGNVVSLMYFVSILSLVIFSNYLALYIKRKASSNFLYLVVGLIVIAGLAALDYFKIISVTAFSNSIFDAITNLPALALGFTLLAAVIFFINSAYLRRNLYIEELSAKKENKTSTDYPFLNRFGDVGELAALELKLILRHKRSKSALSMGFIFLAYGFLFYKQPLIEKDQFGSMLFGAIFITGITIITYGQFMFAWQSAHFDGLLANKVDYRKFIKAKFLLFTISCTIITLLSTFYAFISWKLLLLHLAAYLYNVGFGTVIVLWFATKNYKRLDLSKGGSFNWQGTGAVQWIMGIPLLVLPFVIYLPFGLTGKPYTGLAALALFGLISWFLRNFWIDKITGIFSNKRYKIAEGFRE